MKKWCLTLIVLLFMVVLSGVRIGWFQLNGSPLHLHAAAGVLDLGGRPLTEDRLIALEGEWEFYPGQLLNPGDIPDPSARTIVRVPGRWDSVFRDEQSYMYGTFRLRVVLDDRDRTGTYSLRVSEINSSSRLFVNGQPLVGMGVAAASRAQFVPMIKPYVVTVPASDGVIDISLQIAHVKNGLSARISQPIQFGIPEAMDRYLMFRMVNQLVPIGILILLVIYAGILFFIGSRQRSMLYFLLLAVVTAVYFSLSDDRPLLDFIPLPYAVSSKAAGAAYALISLFLYLFIKHLLPEYRMHRLTRLIPVAALALVVLRVIQPYERLLTFVWLGVYLLLATTIVVIVQCARVAARREAGVLFLMLAAASVSSIVMWVFVTTYSSVKYIPYPFDLVSAVVMVSVFAFIRHYKAMEEQMRTEAAWLQAQIEPHFLFNTINAITILADHDLPRMKKLIDAFGRYLQSNYDFSNSERLVPLERELEVVRIYLQIMQERYGDQFAAEWHIGADVPTDLPLPPLSLQPLVENALHHGILPKAEPGLLKISIVRSGDKVAFTVADDGSGIKSETRQALLAHDSGQRHGVGLYNTNRRLKQRYGRGLRIESEQGKGTTISFAIPLKQRR